MDAVHDFLDTIVPFLTVEWVDGVRHRRGTERLLRGNNRQISLVGCVSFEFMRRAGLAEALAIDSDLVDAGCRVISGR